MAVRTPTLVYDKFRGTCLVTWAGLLNTDVGSEFDATEYTLMSVHWQGTPGVGFDGDMQGTNEAIPTNWFDITQVSNATAASLLIPTGSYPLTTRWMRPSVKAGDGATNMTVHALYRRMT